MPTRTLLQPVAPAIDDPMALLLACHDKVRRFAHLSLRLRDHLAQRADRHPPADQVDAQAREAAQSILRYFEIAAPLHHEDEDRDLYPALRALQDPDLTARVDAVEAEHTELGQLWQAVAPWLRATTNGEALPPPPELDRFATRYPAHAQREEDEVYPAASRLSSQTLQTISAAMVARRTMS